MRVLHTSDWHLGRSFGPVSLHDDQCEFVDWCVRTAVDERVDLVVIAGDVYDRAVPPTRSIELFGAALQQLQSAGIRVVVIAGNHDGPERIAAYDLLVDGAGVHIRGGYERAGEAIRLELSDGPLDVVPIPYLDPVLAPLASPSEADDDSEPVRRFTHQSVVRRAVERAVAGGLAERSLAVAHAFVIGGSFDPVVCESERALSVGGSATVHASLFAPFSYTALGHLHQAQQIGSPAVRYSGTPLAYSFSETAPKQIEIVEIDPSGAVQVEARRVPCGRGVATITGTLRELLEAPVEAARERFVRAVLTDPGPVIDAKASLQRTYPHVVEIDLRPHRLGAPLSAQVSSASRLLQPIDATIAYWTDLYEAEPSESERRVLTEAIEAVSR